MEKKRNHYRRLWLCVPLVLSILIMRGLSLSFGSSEDDRRLSLIPHGKEYIEFLSSNMMENRGLIVLVGAGSNELMDTLEADLITIRNEEKILLVSDIETDAVEYTLNDVLTMFDIDKIPTVIYARYGEIVNVYDDFGDYNVENMRLWYHNEATKNTRFIILR